ncbi:Tetraspanin-8 [Apostasia shenzhenica]|uniref:Tetraspanin-8 n=1 Tax=Apostasia shenzhenica TaxID=1088818 RepID=A0A2I0AHU5_9ASPA|nr:Tetraspanin-8 [Apostasia shenzhenica]
MFHTSNSLVFVVNLLTLLISFPLTGIGLWLRLNAASDCEHFLLWPVLVTGLLLMAVSLLGLFGSCCHVSAFLCLYLFAMFVVIVGLFCFTVFTVVVTNKSIGDALSGAGYKEYRLGDYSHWLQTRVRDYNTWSRIKSCIKDAGVCPKLDDFAIKEANELYNRSLSTIQSGCCKPPLYCGLKEVNATYWEAPKSGLTSNDIDCKVWSNDPNRLCFDCDSCKAGVLAKLKREWKKLAIFNLCLLLFLNLVYSIGCCAFRNSRKDNRYHRYV